MQGRPRKPRTKIFRSFEIEIPSGDKKKLEEITICCPTCHSTYIRNHDTRKRRNTRVQRYNY